MAARKKSTAKKKAPARKKSARNERPGVNLLARIAFCATMDERRKLWRRRAVRRGSRAMLDEC